MKTLLCWLVTLAGLGWCVSVVAGERWYKPVHAEIGAGLYQAHCAACHGTDAEGATNWQQPGPDGHYPPPPLNGSAHAWHHPLAQLFGFIHDGGINMPAMGQVLSRGELLAIIAWFQSLWSDEIYAAWERMNRAEQGG